MSIKIGNDQNILGKEMPAVYINNYRYDLPTPERGNRQETFEKESVFWTDLNGRMQERIKGYRLYASYEWELLNNTGINNLLQLYNETNKTSDLKIKFSVFPRRYSFKITEFEHNLNEGLVFRSAAKLSIEGVDLLDAFPNADRFYLMVPLLGRYGVIRG